LQPLPSVESPDSQHFPPSDLQPLESLQDQQLLECKLGSVMLSREVHLLFFNLLELLE